MKKMFVTEEEVFKALWENDSAECDLHGATYYLHLDENGNIMPSAKRARISFSYTIEDEASYFGDIWYDEPYDISAYYSRERLDNPKFMEIVENLTEQANEYLKNSAVERKVIRQYTGDLGTVTVEEWKENGITEYRVEHSLKSLGAVQWFRDADKSEAILYAQFLAGKY